jgi:hypothetical protein
MAYKLLFYILILIYSFNSEKMYCIFQLKNIPTASVMLIAMIEEIVVATVI